MHKFVLFFIFITNAYSYSPSQMNFGEYEYKRYVSPQIRSILQDFIALSKQYSNNEVSVDHVFTSSRKIANEWKSIKSQCDQIDQIECYPKIQSLANTTSEVYTSILKDLFEKKEIDISSSHFEQFLIVRQNIVSELIKLDALIDELKLRVLFQLPGNKKSIAILENSLEQAQTLIEASAIGFIEEENKVHFRNAYYCFYRPLKQKMLTNNNTEYFKDQLTNLNLCWNEFNYQLSKKQGTISKKRDLILGTIHQRWKSILRVVLH